MSHGWGGERKGEMREGSDFRRGGRSREEDGGMEPSSFFKEPDPASWTHVTDEGMTMWGAIRADGGWPPWCCDDIAVPWIVLHDKNKTDGM